MDVDDAFEFFFQVVGQGFRKIFVEVSVEFIDVSTWMMMDVGRSWPVLVDGAFQNQCGGPPSS